MAERRMFSQKIVESDQFTGLPLASQCLYFHLNMSADDDGFVNNPRRVRLSIAASEDEMLPLLQNGYIISFDNGVICIAHWHLHNAIRKDRYVPTIHQALLAKLRVTNKVYSLSDDTMATNWQPNDTQDKDRIGEARIDKVSSTEIKALANEIGIPLSFLPKIHEWFAYKSELGETQTASTIKATLKQIKTYVDKYGEDAVAKLIDLSISNGWKGIYFERLDKCPNTQMAAELDYGNPEDFYN